MDIVIVGDGKVGFTLASQLDHEGHNVSLDDFDFETTLSSVYTCFMSYTFYLSYNLISMSTPLGNSNLVRISTVSCVGFTMSIKRL